MYTLRTKPLSEDRCSVSDKGHAAEQRQNTDDEGISDTTVYHLRASTVDGVVLALTIYIRSMLEHLYII